MFCRSLIQKYLLRSIGIEISIKQSFLLFLGSLSMLVTPGGTGLLIKSYFIKSKYGGHSVAKSIPLVFVERFFELISIVILITFTLSFNNLIESSMIVIITTMLIVILLLIIKSKNLFQKLLYLLTKIKFLDKIALETNFNSSLQKLLSLKIVSVTLPSMIILTFIESIIVLSWFFSF